MLDHTDQPTKAEVEDLRAVIIPFGASGLYSDRFACIVRLCDAYLAQGEEVERLKAENLALKAGGYRADQQDGE